jgi:peptidoglycan/LPS O-acetylase OafA/YrhL
MLLALPGGYTQKFIPLGGAMHKRIKGFDGLRAIAVLLVFIHHKTTFHSIDSGRLGVWIFFALSGFLIAGILREQRLHIENDSSRIFDELKEFLRRRAFRIFPIYYVLLSVIAVFLAAGVFKREYAPGLPYYATFLSDIYIGYIRGAWTGQLSHLWSLAVEEQFYLLLSPLLLSIPATRHWQICALVAVVSVLSTFHLKITGASDILIYTSPLTNFLLLAMGGIGRHFYDNVARTARTFASPWTLSVSIALVFLFYANAVHWDKSLSPIASAALDAVFGVSVAMVVTCVAFSQKSAIIRMLELPWLTSLGRISYGFYLFHPFIPNIATMHIVQVFFHGKTPFWIQPIGFAGAFVASVVLAKLSWNFIEAPAMRLRDRRTPVAGNVEGSPA